MNIGYEIKVLSGRGGNARSGMSARGVVVHAVPGITPAGDDFRMAACGAEPKGMSLGWNDPHYNHSAGVTCKKCLKVLSA